MKRMHVNVIVKDLGESVGFYATLFGAEPTLQRPGYAKWMLEDPRVNFALVQGDGNGQKVGIEHLGIQAESPQELAELRERIGRAGGIVFDEGDTTCCYHESDKTWVTDAQGVSWETFYTSGESETFGTAPETTRSGDAAAAPKAAATCCADDCCT